MYVNVMYMYMYMYMYDGLYKIVLILYNPKKF